MSDNSISVNRHKVGLVVDREFDDRLVVLSRTFHLWVVESPTNSRMVQMIWGAEEEALGDDLLSSGVTSFQASEDETPEEMCVRLSSTLEEHHGEFGHEPPWTEIEVFGAKLTERVMQAFRELGASAFEITPDGFRCLRTDEGG